MIKIKTKSYWTRQRLILLAFLLLHTIASFYYISHQNITFDEPDYIEYAKRWLHGHPERIKPIDDSKSPLIAVCWLPRAVRQIINPNYQLNDYGRKDQAEGRYIMILFSLITALYVYKWCRQLYGEKGWLLPLLLLLFDPLYLSYSTLISTDLACGAFLVASLYHFNKYLVHQSQKDFWLCAVVTGIGIVTKATLLFLLLLLPLLSICFHAYTHRFKQLRSLKAISKTLAFCCIILLVINCAYYFRNTFMLFGNYHFESAFLNDLKHHNWLRRLAIPLPQAWVQQLDMLKAHADIGATTPAKTYNGVYLFGTLNLTGGFWYYYLVLLFYKLPLGTLVLLLSCVPLFIQNFTKEGFVKRYMFLVIPILFFWIILSFFNNFQTGIRHILLIFPLLFIGLGFLFKKLTTAARVWQLAAAGLVAYTFITVALYYPFIIPYTNEFVTNKQTVYRKIYDSSIDYGQSDSSLSQFLQEHLEYQPATVNPSTGKHAVLMKQMFNTYLPGSGNYKWYRALEPVGNYRYTILLFDITKQDLEQADFTNTDIKIVRTK
ncbi:MAG: glycosyltransferase family 39 protein [Chitinophagaceae bacterium]|nr:glycosyltransferase family 39 protein [Chitinophagaceae bacterium]